MRILNLFRCYLGFSPNINDLNVTKHGIVSYYYGPEDFWYLTGFFGRSGTIMDTIQFQFTQFTGTLAPTAVTTLAPTQSTLTPTIIPTLNPVSSGSVNSPTGQPIAQNTVAMVEDNEAQSIDLLLLIAIIVGAVGFLCLFGELIAFKMRKKRRKAELAETSGIMRESINIATESKWNKEMVQQWLEDIKFPQYYSEFVENGYDSIRVIKAIRTKSELSDILNKFGC